MKHAPNWSYLHTPSPWTVCHAVDGDSSLLTQSENPESSLTPLCLFSHIQTFKKYYWAYFKNISEKQPNAATLAHVTTTSCLDNTSSFTTGFLTCSLIVHYWRSNQNNLSKRNGFRNILRQPRPEQVISWEELWLSARDKRRRELRHRYICWFSSYRNTF